MRIIELNIVEFGGIKDKKIALSDGLNVIYGNNESGKSTVMLFIKFMLYGLPRRSARSNDRDRSLSWDNHRAAGTMLVEKNGIEYLIERKTSMGAKLIEQSRLTDLSTGETISGIPGEVLLDAPAEVFESSCFIPQMRASDINREHSSGAIENMLVSADESIDVTRILERIDKVRKEYKLNRGEGGLLYETEKKLTVQHAKLREATQKHLDFNNMNARLARTEKSIEQATSSYTASKKMLDDVNTAQIIRRFDELTVHKSKLSDTKQALSSLEANTARGGFLADEAHLSALIGARAALADSDAKETKRASELSALPTLSPEESALADMGDAIGKRGGKDAVLSYIRTYDKKRRALSSFGISAFSIAAVCCIASGITFFALPTPLPAIATGVAGLILLAAGIAFAINSSKAKHNRDAACGQYGVSFTDMEAYIDSCLSAFSRSLMLSAEAIAARTRFESAQEDKRSAMGNLRALVEKTATVTDTSANALLSLSLSEIQRLDSFCRERARLHKEIYALETLVNNFQNELSGYDEQKLRLTVHINISELTPDAIERIKTKERFDRKRLELLGTEARNLRESLAALRAGLSESPFEISDTICELEQKLADDTRYYDALMLAKEHIQHASEVMRGSVTPDISRRAGEMMSLISGGKHSAVQATKNFELSVEQDGFLVNAELLSGGTREAAYICLRIALMKRLFEPSVPPLIMDESLCQLDDERVRSVLSLLSKLSDTTQCILFTCHTRESLMCDELKIKNARCFSLT